MLFIPRAIKIALYLALLFSLAACHLTSKPERELPLFDLMPVPDSLNGGGWLERFQFSGLVEQSMLVSTEFARPLIQIAAVSFEGVPLTQLQFDTQTQKLTSTNSLGVELDGRKIIYDMQSAFWPIALLEQHMRDNNRVIERNIAGQLTRRFYRNETLTREITYNGVLIQLNELEQNYRLKIERLEEY
ncbi:DUF3261 domain-containing protein [Pseudoalteromonas sp. KG3]|uniref:DUF3261 domain-containing protein n=1 Tax=Pseudoalteromonas prydzensis TaxID=182141 RepID=A0ABR9FL55_9GAMM|nr:MULTISPECIES: DUF3261 domain-containing protein [Pseudoalteromonas]MBE0457534.1 DUF3261 domain-containing protein [Pseudoalteromonas prydzensis]WKD26129.1 DUF3261 domain-containing protein [Pseudoalteromonas sp. KG3]